MGGWYISSLTPVSSKNIWGLRRVFDFCLWATWLMQYLREHIENCQIRLVINRWLNQLLELARIGFHKFHRWHQPHLALWRAWTQSLWSVGDAHVSCVSPWRFKLGYRCLLIFQAFVSLYCVWGCPLTFALHISIISKTAVKSTPSVLAINCSLGGCVGLEVSRGTSGTIRIFSFEVSWIFKRYGFTRHQKVHLSTVDGRSFIHIISR